MIPKFRAWDKSIRYMDDRVRVTTTTDYAKVEVLDAFTDWRELEQGQYELMQSTGLKDKNGKEIFEGDIVIDGFFEDCCVVKIGEYVIEHKGDYDNDFVTKAFGPFLESDDGFKMSDISDFKEARVVGNIFEDGDLIDG